MRWGRWPDRTQLANVAPKQVAQSAFCEQVVEGPDIDLGMLPIQRCRPGNAGRPIAFGLVTARDVHQARQNVAISRLDLEDIAVAASAPLGTLSSRTSGLRLAGSHGAFSYAAEYARQRELAGNPWHLDSRYALAELGYTLGDATFKAGWESLGGGEGTGNRAFQTPLATKHAFQGWADVFLTTPASGVEDRYAGVIVPLAGGSLQAWYHHFVPERGGGRHGTGTDLSWGRAIPGVKGPSDLAKLARYRSDDRARTVDTDKLWLQLQYAY